MLNDRFILALWVLAVIYLAHRIFASLKEKQKLTQEYSAGSDKYDEIINSEKYKVKGQYDN